MSKTAIDKIGSQPQAFKCSHSANNPCILAQGTPPVRLPEPGHRKPMAGWVSDAPTVSREVREEAWELTEKSELVWV